MPSLLCTDFPSLSVLFSTPSGIPNYVRIFAYNSLGLGPNSDVLTVLPKSGPTAPTSTALSVTSKTSLTTTWSPPVSNNGAPVASYKIEWYNEEPSVEVQMVTTSSNGHVEEIQMIETAAVSDSIANQFTLSFRGEKTSPMFEDVSAADVEAALERLSTIGTVTVTSDRTNSGYSKRAIAGTVDVALGANAITCNSGCAFATDFSRGDLIWVAGEAFRVHLSATFDANTVPLGTVADNSVPATFAGAAASNFIAYKWAYGHVWHVTFNSGHVGNQEPIVAEPATGWTGADVTLNVFTVREGLQPISGYFTLAFENAAGIVPTTSPIAYDASALTVKTALENLITIGSVDVSRARNGYGYSWLITFQTNLGPVNSLIAIGTELTGPQTSISVSKAAVGVSASGYGSQIVTDLTSLSYTISGLTTGTSYMVRIAASNTEGYGPVALTSPLSDIPRETPAAPTSVSLISLSSTSLKVAWSPPADGEMSGGAAITKYKIQWDTDGEFNNVLTSGYTHEFSQVDGTIPYYYNIPITTVGASYFVRVASYNNMGYGPSTNTLSPTTPIDSVPSAVHSATLSVVSDAELQIDWIAPRNDINVYGGDGGRPITQYMIEWDTDFSNPPSPGFKVITDTGLTSYVIGSRNPLTGERGTTLIAGETYYVRIAAYNNLGNGVARMTTPNSATTANQKPIKTTGLSLTVNSATALQSAWTQPSSDGGETFKTAMVEWDTKSTFDSKQTITVSAGSLITGGSFKLSYGSDASAPLTHCIAWNAMASTVETQVESMAGIYDVVVTREGDATSTFNNGYIWTVTFINPVAPSSTLELWADQSACAGFTCSGACGTGERIATSTTSLGFAEIDYVAEQQIVSETQSVQHEVQLVTDTVAVTHERQTITTILPNMRDEIQTITTACADVVAEIQTITTDTADVNEVQHVSVSALDVDEKQQVRTSIEHVDEVQVVKVSGIDRDEVQTFSITETLKTQHIKPANTGIAMSISQIAVSAIGTSAIATYTFTTAGTVSVGDIVSISGNVEARLNTKWTITAVGSGTFTFKATEHFFAVDGVYNTGVIVGTIQVGLNGKHQFVQVASIDFTSAGGNTHEFLVNHHNTGVHKFTAGKTISIAGATDAYFNQNWVIHSVINEGQFKVGDTAGAVVMVGATVNPPATGAVTQTSASGGIQVEVVYTYSAAFKMQYFDIEFCVPYSFSDTDLLGSLLYANIASITDLSHVSASAVGLLSTNTNVLTVSISTTTETVQINNIILTGNSAAITLVNAGTTLAANPGLIRPGDTVTVAGIDTPISGSVLNGAFTVVSVSSDGFTITYDMTENGATAPGDATYNKASPYASMTVTLSGRPVALVVVDSKCDTVPSNQNGVTNGVRGIFTDHDLAPVNDVDAVAVVLEKTTIAGDFSLNFDFTDSNCLNCVTSSQTSATSALISITSNTIPTHTAVQNAINAMSNFRQSLGTISVSISGNTATATHSDTGYVYVSSGDTVAVTGFSGGSATLSASWVVSGTPTRWSFDFDVSTLSGSLSGSIGTGAATVDNAVVVTRTLHAQPAEGATYDITFSGKQVSGNIPLMTFATNSIVGDALDCAVGGVPKICTPIVETTPGHQVDGVFYLTYDDTTSDATTGNNPVGSTGAITTLAIPSRLCGSYSDCSPAERTAMGGDAVRAKIQALSNIGSVNVLRTDNYDGVGGYSYSVTFTSNNGNLALMSCTGSDYTMGIVQIVTDASDVATVTHHDIGSVMQGSKSVTISGMADSNLNGNFNTVSGTATRTSFQYTLASAGVAGSATHAADTPLTKAAINGGSVLRSITGTSTSSSCEVSTPSLAVTQIAYDHTNDVATVTHTDTTGFKRFATGNKIMVTGAAATWANTGWTVVAVTSPTTFTFSTAESNRVAPSGTSQTYSGAAVAHQQGAFTSGMYTLQLPRLVTVNLVISSIAALSNVATVTHTDTTSARLRVGDVVTISGMDTPTGGTYNAAQTVTGTPTSTAFTFTTTAVDATTNPTASTATGAASVYARSASISTTATAAELKLAIEGPSGEYGFGTTSIHRETFDIDPSWGGGFIYTIAFTSLGGDVEDMTVLETTMPNGAVDFGFGNTPLVLNTKTNANPISSPRVPIESNIMAGHFTLSFNGTTTGNIDVTSTDVQFADILNLPQASGGLGVGAVTVSRFHPAGAASGAGPGPAGGWQWAVTFVGLDHGGNVDMLQVDSQSIVATQANVVVTEETVGNQLQGKILIGAWAGSADKTGYMDYYTTAADMESQLENINSIGDVSVTRSTLGTKGPQVRSYQWTITFDSNFHSGIDSSLTWASPPAGAAGISRSWGPNVGDIQLLTCETENLFTSHIPSSSTKSCVVAETRPGTEPLTGTFVVAFDTRSLNSVVLPSLHNSSAISHDAKSTIAASGADGTSMEEILEAMPNIGDVSVSRSPVTNSTGGYTWTITFLRDSYSAAQCNFDDTGCPSQGDVPLLDANQIDGHAVSDFRAAMLPVATTTITTVEVVKGNTLRGDFTLNVNGATPNSASIAWDATAADVDSKLEALSTIGNVDVTRVRTSKFGTHYWVVTFTRNWAHLPTGSGDVLPLVATKAVTESGVLCAGTWTMTINSQGITETATVAVNQGSASGTLKTTLYNEWTITIDPTDITKGVGTVITQGSVTGTLKTALTGADMDTIVISALSGVVFTHSTTVLDVGGVSVSAAAQTAAANSGATTTVEISVLAGVVFDATSADLVINGATVLVGNINGASFASTGLSSGVTACIAPSIDITIIETQQGSTGLTNEFTLQFENSAAGPVVIKVDDSAHAVRTKLEQLTTIGKVWVTRYEYPTSSSGGWGAVAVPDGTRGGYGWQITFIDNLGQFSGKTFPPSSGDLPALVSGDHTFVGTVAEISVFETTKGSNDMNGTFALAMGGATTSTLDYDLSDVHLKSALESIPTIGTVTTFRDVSTDTKLPGTVSILRGSTTATVTSDLRGYLAPGDIVRIGPESVASNKVGTSGEVPVTGTGIVSKGKDTIFMSSNPRSSIFDGQKLRIAGTEYTVAHSGAEVQQVIVASHTKVMSGGYRLKVGPSISSTCLAWDADASLWEATIKNTGSVGEVSVARFGDGSVSSDVSTSPLVVSITQIDVASSGTVATATHDAAANALEAGDIVTINGMATPEFNNFWTVVSVSGNTFVFDATEQVNYIARTSPIDNTYTEAGTASVSAPYGYRYEVVFIDTALTHTSIEIRAGPTDGVDACNPAGGNAYWTHAAGATQDWGITFNAQTLSTIAAGETVTQGSTTGTLTVGVSGETTEVRITAAAGQTFVHTVDLVVGGVGGVTIAHADILTANDVRNIGTAGVASISARMLRPSRSHFIVQNIVVSAVGTLATVNFVPTQTPLVQQGDQVQFESLSISQFDGQTWTVTGAPTQTYFTFAPNELGRVSPSDQTFTIVGGEGIGQVTSMATTSTLTTSTYPYPIVLDRVFEGASQVGTQIHNVADLYVVQPDGRQVQTVTVKANSAIAAGTFTLSTTNWANAIDMKITSITTSLSGVATVTLAETTLAVLETGTKVTFSNFASTSAVFNKEWTLTSVSDDLTFVFNAEEFSDGIAAAVYSTYTGVNSYATASFKHTTTAQAWNVDERVLETELETLYLIDDCTVVRTGDASAGFNHGYTYSIYFDGARVRALQASIDTPSSRLFADGEASFNPVLGGSGNVVVAELVAPVNVNVFSSTSVPLALRSSPTSKASFLAKHILVSAPEHLYKVDGMRWAITMESMVGDVGPLSVVSSNLAGGTNMVVTDDFQQGLGPSSYTISGLTQGVEYHVRSSVKNVLGYGPTGTSTSLRPMAKSSAPFNLAVTHTAHVDEIQTISVTATHVDEIQTIRTYATKVAESQAFVTTGNVGTTISGNIALTALGASTANEKQKIMISAATVGDQITAGGFRVGYPLNLNNEWTITIDPTDITKGVGTVITQGSVTGTLKTALTGADMDTIVISALSGVVFTHSTTVLDVGGVSVSAAAQTAATLNGATNTLSITDIVVSSLVATVTHSDTSSARLVAGDTVEIYGMSEAAFNAVQVITGTPTSTTFTFATAQGDNTYNAPGSGAFGKPIAYTQTCIPFDASAANVESYLQSEIADIVDVTVARSGTGTTVQGIHSSEGYTWTIAFVTTLASHPTDENQMVLDVTCADWGTKLSSGYSAIAAYVNTTDEGAYDLTFEATTAEVKTELEKIPGIGAITSVTRSLVDDQGGYFWTVEFSELLGNVPTMSCTTELFVTNTQCNTVEIRDGNIITGSFIIGMNGETTVPIDSQAADTTVKSALENLGAVSSVTVVRTSMDGQSGHTWTITFTSNVGDLNALSVISNLVGTGVDVTVTEVQKGNYIGGHFRLGYGAAMTSPLSMDTTATELETSLQSMNTVGSVIVTKGTVNTEGGYVWTVTFNDPNLHQGDLPLLSVDNQLTGTGVSVRVAESVKGSEAISSTADLSFTVPTDNGGSAVTKYKIDIDTTSTFQSGNLRSFEISDAASFSKIQQVVTTANVADEVQLVRVYDSKRTTELTWGTSATAVDAGTYRLLHNGVASACFKYYDVSDGQTALTAVAALDVMDGVGTITATVSGAYASNDFKLTIVHEHTTGQTYDWTYDTTGCVQASASSVTKTPVPVFTNINVLGGTFTLDFSCPTCHNTASLTSLAIDPTLDDNSATTLVSRLNAMANMGNGIVATRSFSTIGEGYEWLVTFKGGYLYGAVPEMTVNTNSLTGDDATPTATVSQYMEGESLSGTFLLQYGGATSESITSTASAFEMRTKLEAMSTINTVTVSRDRSWSALPGTFTVTHGSDSIVPTSDHTIMLAPGDFVSIGGETFRISSATSGLTAGSIRLVHETSGVSANFMGVGGAGVIAYRWNNGYKWSVTFESVTTSDVETLTIGMHSLGPASSAAVAVEGGRHRIVDGTRAREVGCPKCARISSLTEGNNYHVRVSAYNAMGYSVPSSTVTVIPRRIPSAPTNVKLDVVSGNQLEVSFNPPTSNGGDTITKYIVQWDTVESFNSNGAWMTNGTATVAGGAIAGTPPFTYLIGSGAPLLTGTSYHVRVRAENSVAYQQLDLEDITTYNYAHERSTPLSAAPANRVPTAPMSVGLSLVGSQTLRLLVTPPARSGGPAVTSYTVNWDVTSTFTGASALAGNATVLASAMTQLGVGGAYVHDVSSLTAGQAYYFKVSAINSVGTGSTTVSSPAFLTPKAAPSTPLTATATTPINQATPITTADVSWAAPASNNGSPITGYLVEWYALEQIKEVQTIETSMTTSGAFALAFNGVNIGSIAHDITASELRRTLMITSKHSIDVSQLVVDSAGVATAAYTSANTLEEGDIITLTNVNEWTVTVNAQTITAGIGSTVVQGSATGILKTELTGSSMVSIVITCNEGVTFTHSATDIIIGGNSVSPVLASTQTAAVNQGASTMWANGDWTIGPSPTSSSFTIDTTEGGRTKPTAATYSPAADITIGSVMLVGDLTVARSPRTNGYVWSITFNDVDRNNGNQPPFVATIGTLSSGSVSVSQVHVQEMAVGRRSSGGTSEVQTVTISSTAAISGFFRLGFGGSGYTNYLPLAASEAEVVEALESLSTVRQIEVSREGDGSSSSCSTSLNGACAYGYRWLVTFKEHIGNLPMMASEKTKLYAAGNAAVSLAILDGDNSVNTGNNAALNCKACSPGETPSEYGHQLVSAYTFSYKITSLVTGREYKIRASATNEQGYSTVTSLMSVTPPKQNPGAPVAVTTSTHSTLSSSVLVNIDAPTSNGGDDVLKYKIEYATASDFASAGSLEIRCPSYPIRKIIRIESTGNGQTINDGYFKLSFTKGGVTVQSEKIWWNTPALQHEEIGATQLVYSQTAATTPKNLGSMESILQDLSNMVPIRELGLEAVKVTRTGPATDGGFVWAVTFLGDGDDFGLAVTDDQLVDAAATVTVTTTITGHVYTNCNTNIEIPGLVQGTPYYVRAFSYNTLGYSLATHAASTQKPMKAPTGPTAVTLSVVSGTALRIIWSPPVDDGGDTITSYVVEWDTLSNFSSTSKTSHTVLYLAGGAPFVYTMTGLTMGQVYYVRVKAANAEGFGASTASTPTSEHPRQLPTAPTNVQVAVTSGSKLTVSFAAPASNGGDTITKYKIEWDKSTSFSSLLALPHRGEIEVFATQNMTYTINSLSTGSVYYVRVSAANIVGYGSVQTSSPTFAVMYNQVPGIPTAATAVAYNKTTMRIDWSPPFVPAHGIGCSGGGTDYPDVNACPAGMGHGTEADGGVAITKYVVEWDTVADFSSSGTLPLKGSAIVSDMTSKPFAYYITNLPCYNYYVRIYAYNTVGQGKACNKDGGLCEGNPLSVTTAQLTCP